MTHEWGTRPTHEWVTYRSHVWGDDTYRLGKVIPIYKQQRWSLLRLQRCCLYMGEWGLEVEVDEGLCVGASYLDEEEDRHDEEADLSDEGKVGEPTTEAEFLLLRGEVQEVA